MWKIDYIDSFNINIFDKGLDDKKFKALGFEEVSLYPELY